MQKAVRILFIYLLGLLICSLSFTWLHISQVVLSFSTSKLDNELNIMLIPTIIGGLIALRMTIPAKSFKIFVLVYACLWVVRFAALYIGNELGEVHIFNRAYRLDLIIYNYYQTVSRLQTPLPFIIYWFINYLFTVALLPNSNKSQVSS